MGLPKKTRSLVWQFFEKCENNMEVQCQICNGILKFSTNTTNMHEHIRRKHGYSIITVEPSESEYSETKPIIKSLPFDSPPSMSSMSTPSNGKKNRSVVWKFFEKCQNETKVQCKVCNNLMVYAKNTTNMRNHLTRKHPTILLDGSQEIEPQCVVDNNDESEIIYFETEPPPETSTPSESAYSTSRSNRSVVWEYFDKCENERKVKCKICSSELKYFKNTTNLHEHIKRKHRRSLSETTPTSKSLPVVSTNETSSAALYPKKRLKLSLASNPTITAEEINNITASLVQMIVLDLQPLSMIENEGFMAFINTLKPEYTIPSKETLEKVLILQEYNRVKDRLMELLQKTDTVSIAADLWSSHYNSSYITVTAHFISDFKFYSVVLGTEEINLHSDHNVAEAIQFIIETFNVTNKILIVVVDGEDNLRKTIAETLKCECCFSVTHQLNFAMNDVVDKNEELATVITKCRDLVTYFKSNEAKLELTETQQQIDFPGELPLLQEVSPRWNSQLMVLEQLLQWKLPITAALASLSNPEKNLEPEEWIEIEEILSLCKPILSITEELSAELYPTTSLIVPLVRGLQNYLRKKRVTTEIGKHLKTTLTETISQHLGNLESVEFIMKAAFLDPRFKKSGFESQENAAVAQKLVTEELSQQLAEKTNMLGKPNIKLVVETGNDDVDIWQDFEQTVAIQASSVTPQTSATLLVKQYIEIPYVPRKQNPMDFWKQHILMFDDLYELARKYLCIPASSVPPRDIFLDSGLEMKNRRDRVEAENVDKLIFLNRNMELFA